MTTLREVDKAPGTPAHMLMEGLDGAALPPNLLAIVCEYAEPAWSRIEIESRFRQCDPFERWSETLDRDTKLAMKRPRAEFKEALRVLSRDASLAPACRVLRAIPAFKRYATRVNVAGIMGLNWQGMSDAHGSWLRWHLAVTALRAPSRELAPVVEHAQDAARRICRIVVRRLGRVVDPPEFAAKELWQHVIDAPKDFDACALFVARNSRAEFYPQHQGLSREGSEGREVREAERAFQVVARELAQAGPRLSRELQRDEAPSLERLIEFTELPGLAAAAQAIDALDRAKGRQHPNLRYLLAAAEGVLAIPAFLLHTLGPPLTPRTLGRALADEDGKLRRCTEQETLHILRRIAEVYSEDAREARAEELLPLLAKDKIPDRAFTTVAGLLETDAFRECVAQSMDAGYFDRL